MTLLLDRELSMLYARALVAIARADHEIGFEEGLRLKQLIDARCQDPLELEDLLLAPPLTADDLAALVIGGPFRGFAVHPGELAHALVSDGVAVVLAKGHVTEREARSVWRFAAALGLSADDFRKLTKAVSRWFPVV
jgi:tellurite resistance protein